ELNAAGYDVGGVDGVPGERTREAVAAWMSDNGSNALTATDVFEQVVNGNAVRTADANLNTRSTDDHTLAAAKSMAETGDPSFTIYSGARDRYDATLLARLLYLK